MCNESECGALPCQSIHRIECHSELRKLKYDRRPRKAATDCLSQTDQ